MPISEEQLETYARFFKAHFDRVGREGSYEPPPSDISSNAPCTPTGLLTPSREDHGVARPTRAEPKRESRPVKIATTEDTSVEQFRQWLAALPRSPPEFFPRLDAADDYIFMNPGMEFDWHARSSRSKVWKEPYLFALNAAGEATIASLGEDSRPTSISPEGEMVFQIALNAR